MSIFYQDEDRLENSEARRILVSKGYDQNLVDKVLEQLWFRDLYISIATYKPFFELLDKYLQKIKIENFTLMGKLPRIRRGIEDI